MTFRIGAVLEELLLPVRNYVQIAPLWCFQADILRLRALFETHGRILAIQEEGGRARGAKNSHLQ